MPRRALALFVLLAACAQGQADDPWGGSGRDIVTADVDDAGSSPDAVDATDGDTGGGFRPSDASPDVAPRCTPAAETCNGLDDDCDSMVDEDAACPCEVIEAAGRTYLLCADERSWPDAQARCRGLGYELAVVQSAAEDALLHTQIAARGFADTWIGMSDALTEGAWAWIDTTPFTYDHWDEGEPNDGGDSGEDCGVIMTRDGRAAEWDDRPCATARPHICETGG